jgi:uncharacterized membrane protein YagU involved in acid resistance
MTVTVTLLGVVLFIAIIIVGMGTAGAVQAMISSMREEKHGEAFGQLVFVASLCVAIFSMVWMMYEAT